jgi:hypothetical protein
VIVKEEGSLSRTENVEVCEGQSGSSVGKKIPSVTRTTNSQICAAMEIHVYRAQMVTTSN